MTTRAELKRKSDTLRGELAGIRAMEPAGSPSCPAHAVLQREQAIRDDLQFSFIEYWTNGAVDEMADAVVSRLETKEKTYALWGGRSVLRSVAHTAVFRSVIAALLAAVLVRLLGLTPEQAGAIVPDAPFSSVQRNTTMGAGATP